MKQQRFLIDYYDAIKQQQHDDEHLLQELNDYLNDHVYVSFQCANNSTLFDNEQEENTNWKNIVSNLNVLRDMFHHSDKIVDTCTFDAFRFLFRLYVSTCVVSNSNEQKQVSELVYSVSNCGDV
jgi:hypothetical protein